MKFKLSETGKTPTVRTHLYGYNDRNLWTTNWWALYVVLGLLTAGIVSGFLLIHFLVVTHQHVKAIRAKKIADFNRNVKAGMENGTFERVLAQLSEKPPTPEPPRKSFEQRFRESNGDLSEMDLVGIEGAEDDRRRRSAALDPGYCNHVDTGACLHCLAPNNKPRAFQTTRGDLYAGEIKKP